MLQYSFVIGIICFHLAFYKSIQNLREKYNIEILICDFRRTKYDSSSKSVLRNAAPLENYTIFDLGADSFLGTYFIRASTNPFSSASYNPDRLASAHKKGMHRYCISNYLFDSDIIISLPRLKRIKKRA